MKALEIDEAQSSKELTQLCNSAPRILAAILDSPKSSFLFLHLGPALTGEINSVNFLFLSVTSHIYIV